MIKKGDFILITDIREDMYYLKVGEVIGVQMEYDDILYKVRFGTNWETGYDDIYCFNKNLSERCKVLKFETQ